MISTRLTCLTCIEREHIGEKVEESQIKYLLSIFSRLHAIISNCSSENLSCVRLLISVMSAVANSKVFAYLPHNQTECLLTTVVIFLLNKHVKVKD